MNLFQIFLLLFKKHAYLIDQAILEIDQRKLDGSLIQHISYTKFYTQHVLWFVRYVATANHILFIYVISRSQTLDLSPYINLIITKSKTSTQV